MGGSPPVGGHAGPEVAGEELRHVGAEQPVVAGDERRQGRCSRWGGSGRVGGGGAAARRWVCAGEEKKWETIRLAA